MKTHDEYVSGLKRQLDDWNVDFARWETRARDAQAEVKERYECELGVLKAQRELALYNLRLLERASTSAWTELRAGADDAWKRMRAAAAAAGKQFDGIPAKRKPKPKAAPKRAPARRAAKARSRARGR